MQTKMNFLNGKKEGVTLVMLVITILVLLVLVGAVIGSATLAIDDSKRTTFAQDLSSIEEAVETYYLANNSLPVKDYPVYNLETLKGLIATDKTKADFESEVTLNGETWDNFFALDLSKAGVKATSRGTGAEGPSDIYIVSEKNLTVYYLKGMTVAKSTYFSLTPALVGTSKVEKPQVSDDSGSTDVTIGGKIKAEKDKKMWTNLLNISVTSDLSGSTDKVFLVIGSSAERDITELIRTAKKIVVPTDLTSGERDILKTQKEITFIKKNNGAETARVNVNVSNLDITAPTVSNIGFQAFTDFNNITVENTDAESGYSEIRYEYLQKKNSVGTIVDFYETKAGSSLINLFTPAYMKTYGKKIDGNVIKLPKYVSKVQIYIYDKAGNYEVRQYTMSDSNITNEPSSSTEEKPSAKAPYVPTGFAHITGEINNGYVIKDIVLGNEFVWVPVNSIDDLKLTNFGKGAAPGTETIPDVIKNSIKAYGGFYRSRYEIGQGNVSKQGQAVWNNINYTDSLAKAKQMYNTFEIATDLMYGSTWDVTCLWLQQSGHNIADSRSWGNYIDYNGPALESGVTKGVLNKTGSSENWKANNIYDMAGNIYEWTQEIPSIGKRCGRGGYFNGDGFSGPVIARSYDNESYSNAGMGFSVTLYKK